MSDTAVAYIGDGGDRSLLNLSLKSLKKYIDRDFDVYFVTDMESIGSVCSIPQENILHVGEEMKSLGFFPEGWNRCWHYSILTRLMIPLSAKLQEYRRVISLDSDIMVLDSEFGMLFDYPCRDYEVIGVGHDPFCNKRPDALYYADSIPSHIIPKMREKVWSKNPIESHIHFCAGLMIWNIPQILENGLDWYRDRLKAFWEGETKGKFKYIDEDFVNMMMDSSAVISSRFNAKPKQPAPEKVLSYHYLGQHNGYDSAMFRQARQEGYI